MGFHSLKTIVEKPVDLSNGKKIWEKSLKRFSVCLLMFLGDESLHSVGSQVVVSFVDVREGLVRFPTVAGFSECFGVRCFDQDALACDANCPEDIARVDGRRIRSVSRMLLFKINSAGVTQLCS